MATISVTKAKIGANDVSFGTGTFVRLKSDGTYWNVRQVSASHIPIIDSGLHYPNNYVEYALGYAATRIKAVSASITTGLAAKVSTSVTTSISATLASAVKYWWRHPEGEIKWTSATRITFPAGYYPVGGKIYRAANTVGWSTQRGAGSVLTQKWSNRGFSYATGAVALNNVWKRASTWLYWYATTYGGSLAFVCANTAPTTKYDAGLYGTSWDTNTYLGAGRMNASSNIVPFIQNGNFNKLGDADTDLQYFTKACRSSTPARFLPRYIWLPSVTNHPMFRFYCKSNLAGTMVAFALSPGSNYSGLTTVGGVSGDPPSTAWHSQIFSFPLVASTANLIYHRHSGSTSSATYSAYLYGWYDKFC